MDVDKHITIVDQGRSAHIGVDLGDKLFLYGGSSFVNTYERIVQKSWLLLDSSDFRLIASGEGALAPENGILITTPHSVEDASFYYILADSIYEMRIEEDKLVETMIAQLPEPLMSGFGCYHDGALIFGQARVYRFELETKQLEELAPFAGVARSQSVYAAYKGSLYVMGGAGAVAYIDAYRYDIAENRWYELKAPPCSFLGAASLIDGDSLIIMGGFDKARYDQAVIDLKDPHYKKEYFALERAYFNWNRGMYRYSFADDNYELCAEDSESARCGATLIKKDGSYYLVLGELKPGLRSTDIYHIGALK